MSPGDVPVNPGYLARPGRRDRFPDGQSGSRGEQQNGGFQGCHLEGRVEHWEPPATADLRSSYRWTDEKKVKKKGLCCWKKHVAPCLEEIFDPGQVVIPCVDNMVSTSPKLC